MAKKTLDQRQVEAEICMAELKKDISFIKENLADNTKQHQDILNTLNTFIESAPSKFADKKTEERVIALEKENQFQKIWIAKIAGGAIVAFFAINIILKHYGWL